MWSKKPRLDPGLQEARHKAKARDKHKCCWPGCKARKKLQVHHIVQYAKNIFLRCDPNNMITLCKSHHQLVTGNEVAYAPFLLSLIKPEPIK